MRMRSKEDPYPLLMGGQICIVVMKITVVISQENVHHLPQD